MQLAFLLHMTSSVNHTTKDCKLQQYKMFETCVVNHKCTHKIGKYH